MFQLGQTTAGQQCFWTLSQPRPGCWYRSFNSLHLGSGYKQHCGYTTWLKRAKTNKSSLIITLELLKQITYTSRLLILQYFAVLTYLRFLRLRRPDITIKFVKLFVWHVAGWWNNNYVQQVSKVLHVVPYVVEDRFLCRHARSNFIQMAKIVDKTMVRK